MDYTKDHIVFQDSLFFWHTHNPGQRRPLEVWDFPKFWGVPELLTFFATFSTIFWRNMEEVYTNRRSVRIALIAVDRKYAEMGDGPYLHFLR